MTTYSKMIARLKPPQSATLDTFTVSLLSCPSSMVSLVVFYAKNILFIPIWQQVSENPHLAVGLHTLRTVSIPPPPPPANWFFSFFSLLIYPCRSISNFFSRVPVNRLVLDSRGKHTRDAAARLLWSRSFPPSQTRSVVVLAVMATIVKCFHLNRVPSFLCRWCRVLPGTET